MAVAAAGGLGLELRVLALEGGVFGFQFGDFFVQGGGEGGFGFELGDFAVGFTKVVEFLFGALVAAFGFVVGLCEAFVFFFELGEVGGLFAVDFGDVV